jgi:stage II sporulation protein AB (anti-sigma F factor)
MVFRLPAVAANIGEARHRLEAYVRPLGVGAERVEDAKVAVTEAVTNVVVHAYPKGGGEFELEVSVNGERFQVAVRDEGCGYAAARLNTAGAGFGTPLMQALSESFNVADREPGGTQVLMTFHLL